jgi:hypothetical protein
MTGGGDSSKKEIKKGIKNPKIHSHNFSGYEDIRDQFEEANDIGEALQIFK